MANQDQNNTNQPSRSTDRPLSQQLRQIERRFGYNESKHAKEIGRAVAHLQD